MGEIEKAIEIIENDQQMECACKHCEKKRWAYKMAVEALREKIERDEGRKHNE